jgi:hypothetical protein
MRAMLGPQQRSTPCSLKARTCPSARPQTSPNSSLRPPHTALLLRPTRRCDVPACRTRLLVVFGRTHQACRCFLTTAKLRYAMDVDAGTFFTDVCSLSHFCTLMTALLSTLKSANFISFLSGKSVDSFCRGPALLSTSVYNLMQCFSP